MEKTFKIKDYALPGVNVADIYNQWSNDRLADGEENIFDMENPADFKLFVDKYGIDHTIDAYQGGRYYLDGNNFPDGPIACTEDELWRLMDITLDLNYFQEAEANFGDINYWGEYVDLAAIKSLFNTQPTKKYVIRQYWTGWVDIPVEAVGLEEAYDLAREKYNVGDFIPDTEDFENGDMENVTDWYKSNKIPF